MDNTIKQIEKYLDNIKKYMDNTNYVFRAVEGNIKELMKMNKFLNEKMLWLEDRISNLEGGKSSSKGFSVNENLFGVGVKKEVDKYILDMLKSVEILNKFLKDFSIKYKLDINKYSKGFLNIIDIYRDDKVKVLVKGYLSNESVEGWDVVDKDSLNYLVGDLRKYVTGIRNEVLSKINDKKK